MAARVRRAWGREARVLYPPVRTAFFRPIESGAMDDVYLCVSALTPYKRVDIAVDACTRLGRRLDVLGAGPELARLQRRAGPTVRFLGWQPDEAVRQAVARCRAFLFPGEEEFGIAPLEATAAGRPVVAYGRGALTETVVDGVTGLFFREQTADALIDAIRRAEVTAWRTETIRAHALRFGEDAFRAEMAAFVAAALGTRSRGCVPRAEGASALAGPRARGGRRRRRRRRARRGVPGPLPGRHDSRRRSAFPPSSPTSRS